MAFSKESQIIGKLNANNYPDWKFKFEMLFIKEDLYDAITETPQELLTPNGEKRIIKQEFLLIYLLKTLKSYTSNIIQLPGKLGTH